MSEKTKLAIIGTVGLPAKYGGFETLAQHLVYNLHEELDISVYCSGKKYPERDRPKEFHGAKLQYLPLEANGISSIFYDTLSILHSLFYADVLLILGVAGAWILPFVKFFTKKKIIISIDGIEWKRDKWSPLAKSYLFWAEGIAVKYSHIDISDNESIQDYTALRYKSLSRVIEYGADHTLLVKPEHTDKEEFPFLNRPYAFKVCRIEPENNIHEVLAAFAVLKKYTLVIVGNWENSEYGKQLKASYHAFDNIHLLNPIYDQVKLDKIRGNALLYLHGHSAGGTNPALVEAMNLGLPIFTCDVSYNRTTTENKARYFKNSEDLIHLVETINFGELIQMGKTMKEIANRRYNWKLIAEKYKNLVLEAQLISSKNSILSETSKIESKHLENLNLAHLIHTEPFYQKR